MTNIKKSYYITPFVLGIIMFFSNFLSTNLFKGDLINFAVWFILSIFAFACGWIITKTIGWKIGGRLVFGTIIAVSFITLFFILLFNEYFHIIGTLSENLILYFLRNIFLGLMGVFGMTLAELFYLQNKLSSLKVHNENFQSMLENAEKESKLIISKAKLDSEKILFEAEKELNNLKLKKAELEKKLNDFIQMEKELINKYDKEI